MDTSGTFPAEGHYARRYAQHLIGSAISIHYLPPASKRALSVPMETRLAQIVTVLLSVMALTTVYGLETGPVSRPAHLEPGESLLLCRAPPLPISV